MGQKKIRRNRGRPPLDAASRRSGRTDAGNPISRLPKYAFNDESSLGDCLDVYAAAVLAATGEDVSRAECLRRLVRLAMALPGLLTDGTGPSRPLPPWPARSSGADAG